MVAQHNCANDIVDGCKNILHFEYHGKPPFPKYTLLVKLILKYCPKNGKVLDLGCGTGNTLLTLRKYGIEGVGIELSRKLVEIAKGSGLNVIYGDITKGISKYFPQKKFDVIYSYHVFEHLNNDERKFVIFEIKKLLKDNGKVILVTPFGYGLEKWNTVCPNCGMVFNWAGHVDTFNRGDLAKEFLEFGFEVVDEFIHTPLPLSSRIPVFLLKQIMSVLYNKGYDVGLWEIFTILRLGDKK